MHEGNCAYFSLSPPVNVSAKPVDALNVSITWSDQTGGQAEYVITNGTVTSQVLSAGRTSATWPVAGGTYGCYQVAAIEGGTQSAWSSASCTTTPSFNPPYNWIGTSDSAGTIQSDPINLVLTAASTVSFNDLWGELQKLVPPSGWQWSEIFAPVSVDSNHCTNYVYADIQGTWTTQDLSARQGGCNLFAILTPGINHFRVWTYPFGSFIAASIETPCGLNHCPISYDTGRDLLLSDIQTAAANRNWNYQETQEQLYAGSTINGVSYDGKVDVITLKT
jgi:hypothetical protein